MLVGTKEVSLSFFLFCCSASSLALASSVEMMFLIFALEENRNLPEPERGRAEGVGLGGLKCSLRQEALPQRQKLWFKGKSEALPLGASSVSAGHKLLLQKGGSADLELARCKHQEPCSQQSQRGAALQPQPHAGYMEPNRG